MQVLSVRLEQKFAYSRAYDRYRYYPTSSKMAMWVSRVDREMIATAVRAMCSRLVMTNDADMFQPPALVFLHYNPRRTLVCKWVLVRERELVELSSSVVGEWFSMLCAWV